MKNTKEREREDLFGLKGGTTLLSALKLKQVIWWQSGQIHCHSNCSKAWLGELPSLLVMGAAQKKMLCHVKIVGKCPIRAEMF